MPLTGGILIGLSATLMLLFNGQVTGISGILSSFINPKRPDKAWRASFLFGLLVGGLLLSFGFEEVFKNTSNRSLSAIEIAGFLVGFGTVMSGGCTSGHGVCGISRLSTRSVVATVTFILFGVLTVSFINFFSGGSQ